MKKSTKTILSLLSASCVAASVGALTSCDNLGSSSVNDKAWYSLYEKACPEKDKTYEDWLQGVLDAASNAQKGDQGEKGDKGDKGDQGDPGQNGQNGQNGQDGKGISSIELVGNQYKITYTDNTSVLVDIPDNSEHIHNYDGELHIVKDASADYNGVGYIACDCESVKYVEISSISGDSVVSESGYYQIKIPLADQDDDSYNKIAFKINNKEFAYQNFSVKCLDSKIIMSEIPQEEIDWDYDSWLSIMGDGEPVVISEYSDVLKKNNYGKISLSLSEDELLEVEGDYYTALIKVECNKVEDGGHRLCPIEIECDDVVNMSAAKDEWVYMTLDIDTSIKSNSLLLNFGKGIQAEYVSAYINDYGEFQEQLVDADEAKITSGSAYAIPSANAYYSSHVIRVKSSDGNISFAIEQVVAEGENYKHAINISKNSLSTGYWKRGKVWLKYIADKSEKLTLSLGGDAVKQGSDEDCYYATEGPSVNVYSSISAIENYSGKSYNGKYAVIDVEAGKTYYISIDSVTGDSFKVEDGTDSWGDPAYKWSYSIGLIDYVSAQHDGYSLETAIDLSGKSSYSDESYLEKYYKYTASAECMFNVGVGDNAIVEYFDEDGEELSEYVLLNKGDAIYFGVYNGKKWDIRGEYKYKESVDTEKPYSISINANSSKSDMNFSVKCDDSFLSGVTIIVKDSSGNEIHSVESGSAAKVEQLYKGAYSVELSGLDEKYYFDGGDLAYRENFELVVKQKESKSISLSIDSSIASEVSASDISVKVMNGKDVAIESISFEGNSETVWLMSDNSYSLKVTCPTGYKATVSSVDGGWSISVVKISVDTISLGETEINITADDVGGLYYKFTSEEGGSYSITISEDNYDSNTTKRYSGIWVDDENVCYSWGRANIKGYDFTLAAGESIVFVMKANRNGTQYSGSEPYVFKVKISEKEPAATELKEGNNNVETDYEGIELEFVGG